MPEITSFLQELQHSHCSKRLAKLLAFNLAPVLKGIKPAELVMLRSECFKEAWQQQRTKLVADFGLCCKELFCSKDRICLLFYNKQNLQNALNNSICQQILFENGYEGNSSLYILLNKLGERLTCEKFPHEIGLFLGYPCQDVKAFIEFGGKNYHVCRYWKVYTDIDTSLQKFKEIDEVRKSAVDLLNSQMPINNAINLLKAV